MVVGRVVSLHRYPVKSMAGEDLASAEVTPQGVLGDRAYALVDSETGKVVSAKRPKRWAGILDCEASFLEPPTPELPVPPVRVTLPDGTAAASDDPRALDGCLSAALGRPVRLASAAPPGAAFEYHWPDMPGLVYEGRARRDEITVHEMPRGTFFDSASLLVLTTTSLAHLRGLVPGTDFDAVRFRPNLVIEPVDGHERFVENDWVGRTLHIGDEVRIEITKPCLRCVMVTLPQRGLIEDPVVLGAVFEHNEGNVGVKATVVSTGRVAIGDRVLLI